MARILGDVDRGLATLTPFRDGQTARSSFFDLSHVTPAVVARAAHALDAAGNDVYFRTQLAAYRPERGRGAAGNVQGLLTLSADVDVSGPGHADRHSSGLPLPPTKAEAARVLTPFPPPTFLVFTGGGYHPWWAVRDGDGMPPAEVADAVERWVRAVARSGADLGYHVDSTGDAARILRVPGTHNRKRQYAEPLPVALVAEGPPYSLDELAPYLAPPAAPRTAPESNLTRVSVGTPASEVTEQWTLATPWAALMEGAGAQLARDNGRGVQHWTRPGKYGGTSAVSHEPPDTWSPVMVNYSESWPPFPPGAGNRLTKFRVFALLHHGGDERAAWRAIAPPLDPNKVDPDGLARFVAAGDPARIGARLHYAAGRLRVLDDPAPAVRALLVAAASAGLPLSTASAAVRRGLRTTPKARP